MIHVRVSTTFPDWPLVRQTPHSAGEWGRCRFHVNEDREAYDYWVVYDHLDVAQSALCRQGNTILIVGEPPSIRRYGAAFLRQFGLVLSCQDHQRHRNVRRSHPAQPWHVGRRVRGTTNIGFDRDYDQLSSAPPPQKNRGLSVVLSSKAMSIGHRRRLEFVNWLAARLGSELDVFGRGIREIEDKWEAVAPYRYHLVLENTIHRDYWTEKLADAYLGWAFPLYAGCPNLADYFPESSFHAVDLGDFEGALAEIRRVLDGNWYEQRMAGLAEARRLVLDEHNLFAVIARAIENLRRQDAPMVPITLTPDRPSLAGAAMRRLRAVAKGR